MTGKFDWMFVPVLTINGKPTIAVRLTIRRPVAGAVSLEGVELALLSGLGESQVPAIGGFCERQESATRFRTVNGWDPSVGASTEAE